MSAPPRPSAGTTVPICNAPIGKLGKRCHEIRDKCKTGTHMQWRSQQEFKENQGNSSSSSSSSSSLSSLSSQMGRMTMSHSLHAASSSGQSISRQSPPRESRAALAQTAAMQCRSEGACIINEQNKVTCANDEMLNNLVTCNAADLTRHPGFGGAEFRRKYWNKWAYVCHVCGANDKIEIHHIIPVQYLNWVQKFDAVAFRRITNGINFFTDRRNLIPLCRTNKNCHIKVGHLGHFARYNPNILRDLNIAGRMRNKAGYLLTDGTFKSRFDDRRNLPYLYSLKKDGRALWSKEGKRSAEAIIRLMLAIAKIDATKNLLRQRLRPQVGGGASSIPIPKLCCRSGCDKEAFPGDECFYHYMEDVETYELTKDYIPIIETN